MQLLFKIVLGVYPGVNHYYQYNKYSRATGTLVVKRNESIQVPWVPVRIILLIYFRTFQRSYRTKNERSGGGGVVGRVRRVGVPCWAGDGTSHAPFLLPSDDGQVRSAKMIPHYFQVVCPQKNNRGRTSFKMGFMFCKA